MSIASLDEPWDPDDIPGSSSNSSSITITSPDDAAGPEDEMAGMDEGRGGMEEELRDTDEGLGGNNVGGALDVAPRDVSDAGTKRNGSGGGIATPFPSPFGSGSCADLPRLRPLDPL